MQLLFYLLHTSCFSQKVLQYIWDTNCFKNLYKQSNRPAGSQAATYSLHLKDTPVAIIPIYPKIFGCKG